MEKKKEIEFFAAFAAAFWLFFADSLSRNRPYPRVAAAVRPELSVRISAAASPVPCRLRERRALDRGNPVRGRDFADEVKAGFRARRRLRAR